MKMLKFRAWDVDYKEMVTLDNFIEKNGSEEFHNENLSAFFQHFYRCEIMQSVGLKDKNQRDIYEGDIVLYSEFDEEDFDNRTEFIDNSIIDTVGYSEKVGYCLKNISSSEYKYEHNIFKMTNGTIEIIGNIYENKELLEG